MRLLLGHSAVDPPSTPISIDPFVNETNLALALL